MSINRKHPYPTLQARPNALAASAMLQCEPAKSAAFGIHEASCAAGSTTPVELDAIAAYLSDVRPVYDAAKNCIGQLSGILLLLQTASLERRNEFIIASVVQQLNRSMDLWHSVKGPPVVQKHRTAMGELLTLLRKILLRFDRLDGLVTPSSPDLETVVTALFSAHRTFLAISDPAGGLSPVDFTAACCNCRPIPGNMPANLNM